MGRTPIAMLLAASMGVLNCSPAAPAAPPAQPATVAPPLVEVSECHGPQCGGEALADRGLAEPPTTSPAIGDRDGDGVSDPDDPCPALPEDKDGFEDDDGCPDLDNDDDGIVDLADQCPDTSETMDGFQDDDGCPDTPTDQAKAAFKLGMSAFKRGDYAGARRHFEAAYRLEPRDPMLFNLAQAALREGDMAAACRYHRRWKATPGGMTAPSNPTLDLSCP